MKLFRYRGVVMPAARFAVIGSIVPAANSRQMASTYIRLRSDEHRLISVSVDDGADDELR